MQIPYGNDNKKGKSNSKSFDAKGAKGKTSFAEED